LSGRNKSSQLHGRDRIVHLLFDVGVIGKGVDGVLEILGGMLLLFLSPQRISAIVRILTAHELSEDPNDFVAHFLVRSFHHLTGDTKLFGAVFLLWHGAVKVALVWALLRKQWWAYPVAMTAFALFVVYQLYRFTHTHSIWLIALSVLDVSIILLTWLEYRRLKNGHVFATRPVRT
jgi:uncharacterized membrane protein